MQVQAGYGIQSKIKQIRKSRLSVDTKVLNKKSVYIQADNIKLLKSIPLNEYDVIDLDTYGVPFKQLEIIFKRRYKGIMFITFIQSMFGILPKRMLYSLGYIDKMIKKCPTLFTRHGFDKFCQYLAMNKIKHIQYYQTDNQKKSYIYFKIN